MSFRPRNQYHLRIANNVCLPLYIYLDDRHLEWFSDRILQHVLADLRPHILTKLHVEMDMNLGVVGIAAAKKGSVDTHRGDFYQFCYFFRKMEPHAVLMKTRNFTAAPPAPPSSKASPLPRKSTKRKSSTQDAARKRTKTSKARNKNAQESTGSRASSRARNVAVGGYNEQEDEDDAVSDPEDEEYHTENEDPSDVEVDEPIELEIEEEEAKPKPILKLKYRGFDLLDRCLCVVVEPWPPIRAATRTPSVAPLFNRSRSVQRESSVAPQDAGARSKTPLFLPDDDDERGLTPAPPMRRRILPPVPLFGDDPALVDSEDEDDYGGMMQFSQVLREVGDGGGGGAELDEETDDVAGIFEEDDDPTR